jgi:7,8-dihydro-6-hydroxymethylpterin-pyrophosphokinase
MELIQAIALLCQINQSPSISKYQADWQLECQQSYLNCVLKRNTMSQTEALQRCILEK